MTKTKEEIERDDDETEREMERILANPILAAEAYPSPRIRARILPLFKYFRQKAKSST